MIEKLSPFNFGGFRASVSDLTIAGIIPLMGIEYDYKYPIHQCLMPISDRFCALERSIMECLSIGCSSIWIIASDDLSPLVRTYIGEKTVNDIPIFYVGIQATHIDKRDNLALSLISGTTSITKTCATFTRYAIPINFYVSFPHIIHNNPAIFKREKGKPFYMMANGLTCHENTLTSFCFEIKELYKFCDNLYKVEEELTIRSELKGEPLDRNALRNEITLSRILSGSFYMKANKEEVQYYYDLSRWDDYRDFLSSKNYNELLESKYWAYIKPQLDR